MPVTVGLLGKLPIYSEFIRSDAAIPELAALDELIQLGLHQAKQKQGSAFEQSYLKGRILGFCWRPTSAGRTLVGLSSPSQDKAGRLYPCTVFAALDAGAGIETIPPAAETFLSESAQLLASPWASVEDLVASVARLRERTSLRLTDEAVGSVLRQATVGADGAMSSDTVTLVVHNLMAVADSLAGTRNAKLTYGLGFPLVGGQTGATAAMTFAVALASRMLPSLGSPSALFWDTEPMRGCVVYFDQPHPAVIPGLITGTDLTEHVFWLHGDGHLSAEERSKFPRHVAAVIEQPNTVLYDVLHAI